MDCILYYATEVVVSHIYRNTNYEQCQKGIRDSLVDTTNDKDLNINCNQNFIHPNRIFFHKKLEEIYRKHYESLHVYEGVITEVISSNILKFPCKEHAGELLLSAITYYIRLRMQQYASQINKSFKKQNQLKKRTS